MDIDEASTSAATMTKVESFESIYPGVLVSYGKFGKCHGSECDGLPLETWPMEGKNFCEVCATKEYGSDFKDADDLYSEISDAKLKCPAYDKEGSCKSEGIDIWEFYRGSCCEPASKVLTENKQAQEKELSLDDEVEAKENRKQYLYCRVCGEFYNDTDRRKSFLTKCGHVACLKCFKDDFTDDIDYSSCPWHINVKDCETEYYQHDVKTLYE